MELAGRVTRLEDLAADTGYSREDLEYIADYLEMKGVEFSRIDNCWLFSKQGFRFLFEVYQELMSYRVKRWPKN